MAVGAVDEDHDGEQVTPIRPLAVGKLLASDKSLYMMAQTIGFGGSPMQATRSWRAQAKGIIRAELRRRNLSYAELAERLTAIGVPENEKNVINKIARGSFTAVFFLQCMEAIGVKNLQLDSGDH